MNANTILFFVAAGIVYDADREAMAAINKATGKRVIPRNRDGVREGDALEACAGVAGKVPAPYRHLTTYADDGSIKEAGKAQPKPAFRANAIGLPEETGVDDRDKLKAALEGASIEFHPRDKTPKLVKIYLQNFFPDLAPAEAGENEEDENEPKI